MAKPIWRGSLNFGLVTVPIELYSATEDHTTHFRQLERDTGDRVRYRRVNERTGEEVDYDNVVKGYELDDGTYVIVEPEELDEIAPGRSRTISIESFVKLEEVDPVYFQKSCWIAPSNDDFARAYGLLIQAIRQTNRAGIAKFVMRDREYVAAVQLIESMSEEWQPERFHDTYSERVRKLVADKEAGRTITPAESPDEPTKVVDLFDALSQSVRGRGSSSRGGSRDDDSRSNPALSEIRKSDLDSMARDAGIKGRSKMSRRQLEDALRKETGKHQKKAS